MRKKELKQHIKIRKKVDRLFIGNLIKTGNKSRALSVYKYALQFLKKCFPQENPYLLVQMAVEKASPVLRLRSKRFGALVHKLPYYLPPPKAKSYAIRWIIEGAKVGNRGNLGKALSDEIISCIRDTGYALRKRLEVHKIAAANRAYMRDKKAFFN